MQPLFGFTAKKLKAAPPSMSDQQPLPWPTAQLRHYPCPSLQGTQGKSAELPVHAGGVWTYSVSIVDLLHVPLALPGVRQQGDGPIRAPTGQD